MTNQTSNRPVHHYDTQRHRIACDSGLAEDHSTKHVRGVTCHACLELIRERAAHEAPGAEAASAPAGF